MSQEGLASALISNRGVTDAPKEASAGSQMVSSILVARDSTPLHHGQLPLLGGPGRGTPQGMNLKTQEGRALRMRGRTRTGAAPAGLRNPAGTGLKVGLTLVSDGVRGVITTKAEDIRGLEALTSGRLNPVDQAAARTRATLVVQVDPTLGGMRAQADLIRKGMSRGAEDSLERMSVSLGNLLLISTDARYPFRRGWRPRSARISVYHLE